MPLRLFFNHNVRGAVASGLRQRGVDLLTAYEGGAHELEDPELLQRSVLLDRVLYTNDDDLLTVAEMWREARRSFPGLIYVHQTRLSIGEQVRELELIAKAGEAADLADRILFLPL